MHGNRTLSALDRLLLADLKHMWKQCAAICAVLTCGVGLFVMSTSTVQSLDVTQTRYYNEYRFGDVFVELTRAPNQLLSRMQSIPGVAQVELRVVREALLDIPDMVEPATCRLVSIGDDPARGLNAIHLRRGRMPDASRAGEVVVHELFAEAHGLRPGDTLDVIMGGRKERLKIVGIGLSPEYVYAVKPGQLLPDNRRFGIVWMPYRQLATAFTMEGAFNNASLQLLPRASVDTVLQRLDLLTRPYGGRGAYTRDEQLSHRHVEDEMKQMRSMAFVIPFIFLAVAAFLLNLVLTRMVHQQKEEMATLRAFGYTRAEVGLHYLKLLLLLVVIGLVGGVILGASLARWRTGYYGNFFRFPILEHVLAWDRAALAAVLSFAAGLAGGLMAVRRAMGIEPAVAMRPEPPPTHRRSILERMGLRPFLSPVALTILRRMERRPLGTLLSVLGVALGVAILVLGSFLEDTIEFVMDTQFERSQRQDLSLVFTESISQRGLNDLYHLPGVTFAEPFRAAAARVRHGTNARRVTLMGLEDPARLFRVLDENQRQVDIAPNGLTISQKLAQLLDVERGDALQVEFLEGRQQTRSIPINAIFPDYTEPGAYLPRGELNRILGEPGHMSGAFVTVSADKMNALHTQLKETPRVAGVGIKDAAMQSFRETVAASLRPLRLINVVFAFIITFGVIYNCALITLSESSRELATLRVLGYTRFEVSAILIGELALITMIALPIGLPAGYGFSYLAALALDTETHRFPLVVERSTFAYAAAVTVLCASVSALIVRRMLDKLDMVSVLKAME